MGSADDRIQAERLLKIHRRRLELLEERKAKQGDYADVSLDLQIDEERANVEALIGVLKPTASPIVQEVVKRNTGEIDIAMLFIQGVQSNSRITSLESQMGEVKQQLGHAAIERFQTREAIEDFRSTQKESERRRRFWQPLYIAMWIAILLIIILGIAFGRVYL